MSEVRGKADRRRNVIATLALLAASALSPHRALAQDASGCPLVSEASSKIVVKKAYKAGAIERDEDAMHYNKASTQDLNQFRADIGRLSDQVLQGNSAAKTCFEGNLARWVANGPMTVIPNQQAGFEQTWALAGIALSIIKAEAGGANLSPDVARWLRTVSDQVRTFHDQRNSMNNHRAWAALAVGASAYILHDDASWRWAMASEAAMINQILPDGTLTSELSRGPRATAYTFFTAMALLPLNMLRRCRGGVDAHTQEAMTRLMTLVHKFKQDPQILAAQAGTEQKIVYDLPIIDALEGGPETERAAYRLGGSIANLRQSVARCR